jgi:hypothetical protein
MVSVLKGTDFGGLSPATVIFTQAPILLDSVVRFGPLILGMERLLQLR